MIRSDQSYIFSSTAPSLKRVSRNLISVFRQPRFRDVLPSVQGSPVAFVYRSLSQLLLSEGRVADGRREDRERYRTAIQGRTSGASEEATVDGRTGDRIKGTLNYPQ